MKNIIYVATCITLDGEVVEVVNSDYNAMMDGIDRYGFDVLDIKEENIPFLETDFEV